MVTRTNDRKLEAASYLLQEIRYLACVWQCLYIGQAFCCKVRPCKSLIAVVRPEALCVCVHGVNECIGSWYCHFYGAHTLRLWRRGRAYTVKIQTAAWHLSSNYYSARSYMLRPNIGFTLLGNLAVFTHSAITLPKVNHRYAWNLEHSEYICWWLALADFGRDPSSSESLKGRLVNNARFRRFSAGNISRTLNRTTSIGVAVKTFGTEFWKFYRKGSFFQKKRKNYSTNFKVLRLQAAITPQWLQIARKSLPK